MSYQSEKHPNRPHCLYLWYLRGEPVCSEEIQNRECPYEFWRCEIKVNRESDSGIARQDFTLNDEMKVSASP